MGRIRAPRDQAGPLARCKQGKTANYSTGRNAQRRRERHKNQYRTDPLDDGDCAFLSNVDCPDSLANLGPNLKNDLNDIKGRNLDFTAEKKRAARSNNRQRQASDEGPLAVATRMQRQASSWIETGNMNYIIPRKQPPTSSERGLVRDKQHLSEVHDTPRENKSILATIGSCRQKIISHVTQQLRGRFSSGSSISNTSSCQRPQASNDVVDLCDSEVEESTGVQQQDDQPSHAESPSSKSYDSQRTSIESSTKSSASIGETSSSSASTRRDSLLFSNSSQGQSSASRKDLSSQDDDHSVEEVVAVAYKPSPQDSTTRFSTPTDSKYLSAEDLERLQRSATGTPQEKAPARSSNRLFGKKGTEYLRGSQLSHSGGIAWDPESSGDSPKDSICILMDDIKREPYKGESTTKSTLHSSKSASSGGKGPANVNNWGASAYPKSKSSLTFSKQNGQIASKTKRASVTAIVPGRAIEDMCPRRHDPIEDSDSDLGGGQLPLKRRRLHKQISAHSFHDKRNSLSRNTRQQKNAKHQKKRVLMESDQDHRPEYASDRVGRSPIVEEVDAVRIAIGKRVFAKGCKLRFKRVCDDRELVLCYETSGGQSTTHRMKLHVDSVYEMKYFLADEEDDTNGTTISIDFDECAKLSFLALQIKPTKENGLSVFSNAYAPSLPDSAMNKKYIAIEFRSNNEFRKLLNVMKHDDILQAFVGDGSKLTTGDAEEYGKSLVFAAKKEREERESSIRSPRARRTRGGNRGANASNKTLLVFPFGGDEEEIDNAAEGLRAASIHRFPPSRPVVPNNEETQAGSGGSDDDSKRPALSSSSEGANKDESKVQAKPRAHMLTIREEDVARLEPGEFLNDTLVDFWMQWIWRKERQRKDAPVHFFTSHFYTALSKDGPQAVTSWTARKNINIFSKVFVFIPVNQSLHWSLCTVVNPGAIMTTVNRTEGEEPGDEELFPCLLFMDSLKAHHKARIASTVREWLNSEWKRLKMVTDESTKDPFDSNSMKVFDPRVPYQDNSWDCGVFVCRYADGLYSMRDRRITFGDMRRGSQGRFRELITDSEEFDFDRDDIVRIRAEMGTLIGNLSTLYLPWRSANDKAEKEARKKEKEVAKQRAVSRELDLGSACTLERDESAEAKDVEGGKFCALSGLDPPDKPMVDSCKERSVHCDVVASDGPQAMEVDDFEEFSGEIYI